MLHLQQIPVFSAFPPAFVPKVPAAPSTPPRLLTAGWAEFLSASSLAFLEGSVCPGASVAWEGICTGQFFLRCGRFFVGCIPGKGGKVAGRARAAFTDA
eukprot:3045993-Rhodomonas_salina.2